MKRRLGLLISMGVLPVCAETVNLYVGTSATEGIWQAELDTETCQLGDLQLAVEQVSPSFVVKNKGGEFWYSTASDPTEKSMKKKGLVASYQRDAETGALTLLNTQPSMGAGPCHVNLDQTGTCLFVANYAGGGITSYKLSEDKSIGTPVSVIKHVGSSIHPKRQKSPHAHSSYMSADNRFLYVCDLGIDEVLTYTLDEETAKLRVVGSTKITPGAGPRHMDFSNDGKRAFLLNELAMTVDVMERDVLTGTMSKLGSHRVLAKAEEEMSCSEIRVSDDNRFLYTANRDLADKGRDSISVFKVKEDGSLQRIQVVPVGVWIPRHFDITPDGKCVVVAGQRADSLSILRRNVETGKLTPVSLSASIKSPMWIGFVKE